MASNVLIDIFRIRDLRNRILFTLAVLSIFRFGATLPIPGINVNALKLYFVAQESGGLISVTDYLDFFAGGAFKNFSIFMLGIMPYISMSIIMQLLLLVFPS
ncbi:MAG: preprotein translocase subunit SecY, partial [Spirochaetaceae bacterium]|nr:preprotein translocase subunit SecY [Spirochaetaceae bacterium]